MYDFDECREIAEDETQVSGNPYAVVQDAEGVCFVLTDEQATNLAGTGRYTVRFRCWIEHRGKRMLVGQLEEL